jgi:hypothetical protein
MTRQPPLGTHDFIFDILNFRSRTTIAPQISTPVFLLLVWKIRTECNPKGAAILPFLTLKNNFTKYIDCVYDWTETKCSVDGRIPVQSLLWNGSSKHKQHNIS